jgi:hypothetical protein
MKNLKTRSVVTIGGAALMLAAMGAPAAMADTGGNASVTVTEGTLSASFAAVDFGNFTFDNDDVANTALAETQSLIVTDQRGTSAGWNVSVSVSDLASGANVIPAGAVSVASAGTVSVGYGQALPGDATGPRASATVVGTLDGARSVALSDVGQGTGEYTIPLDLELIVPNGALPGVYSGTVTVDSTFGV